VGDLLEGTGGAFRAATTGLALALLIIGSAVRANAAVGGHVPAVAVSAVVATVVVYGLPALGWLLEPAVPKSGRPSRPVRVRPLA
jgi:hypothetical protein